MTIEVQLDGITHINIYSKGRSSLGRALTNMCLFTFEYNDLTFHSVEQAWHYFKFININEVVAKSIMNMDDAGAEKVSDFTYVGHPSTYMLNREQVVDVFNVLDLKFANKSQNYWVVEIADGILQRETAMLLASPEFRSRIHRIVFCAGDALGALSGKRLMKDKYGINIDMLSGVFTAAPLHVEELKDFTKLPVLISGKPDLKQVADVLA